MPVRTSDEAKAMIEEWLISRALPAKDVNREGTTFQIESRTETNIAFAIMKPERFQRSVFVATKIEVHAEHFKALCSMNLKEQNGFLWELKKELLVLPPTFMFQSKSDQYSVPESIQFTKEISFDELTEGRLVDAMDQTCRGVILVTWIFLKTFGPAGA